MEKMQDWILFQAAINIDREVWSQPQKTLKKKKNFLCEENFSFYEMKIFPIKNSSSE